MRRPLLLLALALLLSVCRAQPQWAYFSATHFAVLQSSAVIPAPTTTSYNTGLVLLNAANITTDRIIEYAIVTNATGVTDVAAYLFISNSTVGQLLVANISRPAQGYGSTPPFYTGTLDVTAIAANLPNDIPFVAATQLYIEIHTTAAGGAELRGNVRNVAGLQTHTAVLTASQTTPPLSNGDGGIAVARIQGANFVWAGVWTPRDMINNGVNFWAPADVGVTAAMQSLQWIVPNATTATSGLVTSLSSDGTQRFSKPNFDNSKTYLLVQTVTDPAASTGRIRGQFNPVTLVNDAAFTPPPTTPSGALALAASLAAVAVAALLLLA